MRITTIQIYLEPKEGEEKDPVCLKRDENKLWTMINPDNSTRGLYSGEIRLATLLQEVIEKFHGGHK